MIAGLLDHLWQSSLFAGGAGLLAITLRRNMAALRFKLWFAASLKFLLPFATLAALGESLSRLFPPALPHAVLAIQPAAERLSAPVEELVVGPSAQNADLVELLACIWLLGFAAVLGLRLMRWLGLRALIKEAHDWAVAAPVRVKICPSLLEPGLVGILKPVVLIPEGLVARLSDAERDSILAHELGHLCRRDNLTAAIHMLVEALFWFWPPVWLIGARLIAEREQACDEGVLANGHDPEVYAGSILKVCRFCVQSPLACVAGASGANLNGRVRWIMGGEVACRVHTGQKLLLAGSAFLALALPLAGGFIASPLAVEVRQKAAAVKSEVTADLIEAAVATQKIAVAPTVPVEVRHLPRLKIAAVSIPSSTPAEASPPPLIPSEDAHPATTSAPSVSAPVPQPSVSAPAQPSVKDTVLALYPRGTGEPDAVTCRLPQPLPGSRLPGPQVCETNRIWATLRARHEDIAPDGQTLMFMDGLLHPADLAQNCSAINLLQGASNLSASAGSYCL